jgi:hypothetical protein
LLKPLTLWWNQSRNRPRLEPASGEEYLSMSFI